MSSFRMIKTLRIVFTCMAVLALAIQLHAQPAGRAASNWGHWRGPEANGVSPTANPPLEWNENKNIQWKVSVPGQGSSSPIVWENKVFLLTAIDTKIVDPTLPKPEDQPQRVFDIRFPNTTYKFVVLCLDRETGKELWRQTAIQNIPHEGHHKDNTFASAAPTTDGQRLYCFFGSAGLYCYDLDGALLWKRDLGKAHMGASLGEGTSPVVYDDKLVIVRDHAKESAIHVLNAKTGETLWSQDRDEPNTWATPRIINHSGKTQVITSGANFVRSYDLDNGQLIWQCGGLTQNAIPSPVTDENNVYCMTGYKGFSLLAIPLNAKGDISNSSQIAWTQDVGTPYTPSPILYDGMLLFTQSNQGILTALDAKTGATLISRTRLSDIPNIYASPVGANDRIYFTGRNGTTMVLLKSKTLNVLATNELDDAINASAALAGDQLFLRGANFLYCIANSN